MQKATIPDETIDTLFNRTHHRTPAPQPARGLVGGQACAVCQLRTNALICRECAEAPEASRARILAWLNGNMDQANVLLAEWDACREPHQAAWDRIEESRLNDPPYTHAGKCAAHVKAGNIYGRLLDARDRYELALQPLNIERARLEKALEALEEI